ncbi:MAG TPA: adenylate/guanylate cyclase domain-containing protein [Verrucomicrobiae bacterium]|nr:adenylate/guanylate cyclase domain-containing protein [Verrucomicrobiae bacterium]
MTKDRRSLFLSCAAGAVLSIAIGAATIYWEVGQALARFSYDLPFVVRNSVPDEVVLVYIDSKVKVRLGQPTEPPLNRRYHTKLVERLTQAGAKLILYDIIFDNPDPENDPAFAEAMKRNGKVVLVADYMKTLQGSVFSEAPVPPIEPLRTSCRAWGIGRVTPDLDYAIRTIDGGAESCPSVSWMAATVLSAKLTDQQRLIPKWLNYYCAPWKLSSADLDRAIDAEDLPTSYFKDKIVIVGGRQTVATVGAERDQFGNPHSRFGTRFSTGAEVHALSLLNLLYGDWLIVASQRAQLLLVVLCGCALGIGLPLFRPWTAIVVGVFAAIIIFVISVYFQHYQCIWWTWAAPAMVQMPMALAWAVGWRYVNESKRRQRLRQAFSVYLSPHLADQIARSEFDLALGGKQVEATVMFTDIAGFTTMSEKLAPAEVSKVLTTYFTRTTRHILERDGTIIKFLGDGVMAVWGAPLGNVNHRRDAVLAACRIIDESKTEIAGRRLRTRIGINSGSVLAGNLGSEFRFDYATIGATTNLASRLESLNKLLGTDILITEATRQGLPPEILTRCIGQFVLSGTTEPVELYEVITEQASWSELFAEALDARVRGDLATANNMFQKVIALRGGRDGPSEFYLSQGSVSPGPIRIDSK